MFIQRWFWSSKMGNKRSKLRDYINNHEQPFESSEISEIELTYVENELGITDNYRKVIVLNWNTDKDIFVVEFSDIAEWEWVRVGLH